MFMNNASPHNPNRFDPPTAQQLERHLELYPPMMTTGWQARLPQFALIGAGVLMVLALLQPALAILPVMAMVALVVYVSGKTRAAQELGQRVTRAWEMAMIRRYRDALGEAWRLLPACRNNPELHGRVVTIIAHILGEMRSDDAADIAYTYLLDRLPKDHPLALRLRLQRAIVALSTDRLADADDELRRLRGQAETAKDPSLNGVYTLARLLQDVRTGHYADAVNQADATAEALKPLGVEAGYGYALLGLCNHMLGQRTGESETQMSGIYALQAKLWWDRATILIPPAALLFRFPELEALLDQAPTKKAPKKGSGVVLGDASAASTDNKRTTHDPFLEGRSS